MSYINHSNSQRDIILLLLIFVRCITCLCTHPSVRICCIWYLS